MNQSKTGQPLVLPILDDVGWALIDYLKHGRPPARCSEIFVRHNAPFEPLGSENNIHKAEVATKVAMPTLGGMVEEGTITKWYKREGDPMNLSGQSCFARKIHFPPLPTLSMRPVNNS